MRAWWCRGGYGEGVAASELFIWSCVPFTLWLNPVSMTYVRLSPGSLWRGNRTDATEWLGAPQSLPLLRDMKIL